MADNKPKERAKPIKHKGSKDKSKDLIAQEKKMQVNDHAHAEQLVQKQIDAGKELRDTLTTYLQFKMKQEMKEAGVIPAEVGPSQSLKRKAPEASTRGRGRGRGRGRKSTKGKEIKEA